MCALHWPCVGVGVGAGGEVHWVVYARLLRLSSSATVAVVVAVVGLDMPLVAMHANKI